MKECDCRIGTLCGDAITKESIIKEAKSIARETNYHRSVALTAKQVCDNRRGYLSRFNYCPYCGEEIDWKYIIKSLKV